MAEGVVASRDGDGAEYGEEEEPVLSEAERLEAERHEQERLASIRKEERRGSDDGPTVPFEFREAALAESSRSHEWRQKLMRMVVGGRGPGGHADYSSKDASTSASPEPQRDARSQKAAGEPGGMNTSYFIP
jgi:hypothetical protein